MALFLLKARLPEGDLEVVAWGNCLTCARRNAANNAEREGPATWLDPSRSTIRMIPPDTNIEAMLKRGAP